MHGVKRDAPPLTDAERAQRAEKLAKYNQASAAFMTMRASKQYDEASYNLTAKLMEVNPDWYSLWNFRKETLLHFIQQDPTRLSSLIRTDLDVSFKSLMKNPKCYSAWHHRLWLMDLAGKEGGAEMAKDAAKEELKLCNKMLEMDARNFHCWKHRRAVATRAHVSAEEEFNYTTEKIHENFSNYSAWHYRSKLIPRIYTKRWMSGGEGATMQDRRKQYEEFLDAEFTLVKNAFYTEPNDQSAWLYHRWLLGRVIAHSTQLQSQVQSHTTTTTTTSSEPTSSTATKQLDVLGISLGTHLGEEDEGDDQVTAEQAEEKKQSSASASNSAPESHSSPPCVESIPSFTDGLIHQLHVFTREWNELQELLSIEPDCKWALLTSSILHAGIQTCQRALGHQPDEQATAEQQQTTNEEDAAVFDRLIQLDPMRTNYYKDVREKFITQRS